jgi:hypothetical protein
VAVIEEAQSVLSQHQSENSPFVQWVKEGRKYELGAIMVTQQPGSIDTRLLSQGDNFFSFHLTSATDLGALERVNAHFSQDVLTSLLSEPIRGNAYFWAAPAQPFVLPVRVLNFETEYKAAATGSAASGAQLVHEAVVTGLSSSPAEDRSAGATRGGRESAPPGAAGGLETTPAEAFEKDYPRAMEQFCHMVEECLLAEQSVRLWSSPKIGDTLRDDVYLVKAWNLAFAVGDRMTDPEVCRLFASQLRDRVAANPDRIRPALATRGWLAVPQSVTQTTKNQVAFLVLADRLREAAAKRGLRLESRVKPYPDSDLEVTQTADEGQEE